MSSKLAHYWVVALSTVLSLLNIKLDDGDTIQRHRLKPPESDINPLDAQQQEGRKDDRKKPNQNYSSEKVSYVHY